MKKLSAANNNARITATIKKITEVRAWQGKLCAASLAVTAL